MCVCKPYELCFSLMGLNTFNCAENIILYYNIIVGELSGVFPSICRCCIIIKLHNTQPDIEMNIYMYQIKYKIGLCKLFWKSVQRQTVFDS